MADKCIWIAAGGVAVFACFPEAQPESLPLYTAVPNLDLATND